MLLHSGHRRQVAGFDHWAWRGAGRALGEVGLDYSAQQASPGRYRSAVPEAEKRLTRNASRAVLDHNGAGPVDC